MPPWWSDRLPVSPPTLPRLAAVRWTAAAAVLTRGCMSAARRNPGSGGSRSRQGLSSIAIGEASPRARTWPRATCRQDCVYADKTAQGSPLNRSCAGQRPAARVGVAGPTPGLTCGFCSVGRRFTPVKWRARRQLLCASSRARIPHQDQRQRMSMNIPAGQTGRDDLTARVFQAFCQDYRLRTISGTYIVVPRIPPGLPGPAWATSHARSATTSTQTRNDPHPALQPTWAVSSGSGPPGAVVAPDRRWFAGGAWLRPWRRDRSGGHPRRVMCAPPPQRRIRASGG